MYKSSSRMAKPMIQAKRHSADEMSVGGASALPSMMNIREKEDKEIEERDRTRRRLSDHLTRDEKAEVFCVKFSNDGRLIAGGQGDGSVNVYNTATSELLYRLLPPEPKALPVTSIRWRPDSRPGLSTRNVLIAASADGTLRHWHVTSSKCLNTITEKGHQIFCCDYRADGEKFVTAGRDSKIRLYDEVTKTCESVLSGGSGDITAGHSSRIFSVKNVAGSPFTVVSGGWDNTIQVWDTRAGHAVRSIFGPHVCGDAIDVRENTILSGSWRPHDSVQLWDMGTGQTTLSYEWKDSAANSCLIYAAQFSHNGTWIAAGGSGANEAKVLKRNGQVLGEMFGFSKGIFTLDFSPDDSMLAVAGSSTFQAFETRTFAENDVGGASSLFM
eukprot:m51a1_g6677 hypothetical protein (385) ;mRNA; r:220203-221665